MRGTAGGSSRRLPRPRCSRSRACEQWRRRGAPVELLSRAQMCSAHRLHALLRRPVDRRGGRYSRCPTCADWRTRCCAPGGQLYSPQPGAAADTRGPAAIASRPPGAASARRSSSLRPTPTPAADRKLRRSVVAGALISGRHRATGRRAAHAYPARAARRRRTPAGCCATSASTAAVAWSWEPAARSPRRPRLFTARHHYRAVREIYPQLRGLRL